MTGSDEEEEGVPGWIPPDEVRLLGKLVWGRKKAREKGGPQAEGEYVSTVSRYELPMKQIADGLLLDTTDSGLPLPRCNLVRC